MVHVNLRRSGQGYLIEVSVDGAAWIEHWQLSPGEGTELDRDLRAANTARIYASGIRFGGREARLTALGKDISVPDLAAATPRDAFANTLEDFAVGDRVALHPGLDLWARGVRYGTVIETKGQVYVRCARGVYAIDPDRLRKA